LIYIVMAGFTFSQWV